jgi:hypothetical protein
MGGWEVDRVMPRRVGEVIIVTLLLSLGAPAVASAAGGNTPNPQPQKAAPSSASPTPAPDPAPQAQTLTSSSHTPVATSHPVGDGVAVTPVSTPSPRVTTPSEPSHSTGAEVRAPALPATHAAARSIAHATQATPPAPRHHAAPRRTDLTRPTVTHKAAPSHAPFGLTLLSPEDLPRLPAMALADVKKARPGGALLLFSALALGGLVVASLTLLRRLTRLHREWTETTAR